MAFIEGRPLSDYVSGDKRLDQKAVAGIIRKLALALEVLLLRRKILRRLGTPRAKTKAHS